MKRYVAALLGFVSFGVSSYLESQDWQRISHEGAENKVYSIHEEERTSSWFGREVSIGWVKVDYIGREECGAIGNLWERSSCFRDNPEESSLYRYEADCSDRDISYSLRRGGGEMFHVAPGETGWYVLRHVCGE